MSAEEEQEALAYEMADDIHEVEIARWSDEDLAYDGSAWPPRRELTPRERDILTRIIGGWWHRMIEIDANLRGEQPQYVATRKIDLAAASKPEQVGDFTLTINPFLHDSSVAWMRMSLEECQILLNLRDVLTPRQD